MNNKQPLQEGREIKLMRALILGNFYHQKVKIVRALSQGYDTVVDTIVGIKEDIVLTKGGLNIPKGSIMTIYQL